MYAVVQFVKEKTVSEVPDCWLVGNDQCWWPSKNVNTLILKGVPPGNGNVQWQKHLVRIENTCLSFEAARKKAQYIEASSSDENCRGRGRRIKYKSTNDDYSYDSDNECSTKLTNVPKPPKEIFNKAKEISLSQRKFVTYSQPLGDSMQNNSQDIDLHNIPIVTSETFYNEQDVVPERDEIIEVIVEVPNTDELRPAEKVPHTTAEQSTNNFNRNENTDETILRLLVKMSLQLDSIDQRISNLEKARKPQDNEYFEHINRLVPMTFDTMTDVENLLSINKNVMAQMKDYLNQIGGNSPRDNIHRILSKLFTNECASKCSWKGHRGNKQVSNLKVIELMTDVVIGAFSYLQKFQIEQISAEWFRFARQRLDREKKHK